MAKKENKEFTIAVPVNNMVGADLKTFDEIVDPAMVDDRFRTRYRCTRAVASLFDPLTRIDEKRYRKRLASLPLDDAPVFILGHWRSGTTYVHNLLSQDRNFGYNTTYQTVFPHFMLWGQPFLKFWMHVFMPKKRATDGVRLDVDLPQEEEFGLVNMMPYTFYNFWFLPHKTLEYSDKYLLFNNADEETKRIFKDRFEKLIRVSLWNTKGKKFLSKNPPHTGRIPLILEMFPNAKFIYLMRNPYTVFRSTKSFFTETIKPLQFQEPTPQEMESNILKVYADLYHKYEKDKALIPEGNLIEMRFEDIESDPLGSVEKIYKTLSLEGFEANKANFERYIRAQKSHKKNAYRYDEATRKAVEENWGFALDDWGYERIKE